MIENEKASAQAADAFFALPILYCLAASVVVVDANDVVFFEIRATLNFDELEWNAARIVNPVCFAKGNIDGFVLAAQMFFAFQSDFGGAADDDPMLGAVIVNLH